MSLHSVGGLTQLDMEDGGVLSFRFIEGGTYNGSPGYWQPLTGTDTLVSAADGSWTYRRTTDDSTWRYQNALLVSITERNGWAMTFTRDATGRVVRVTNHFGRYLAFGYTPAGSLESVTMPDGQIVRYMTDAQARLVAAVQIDGTRKGYLYEDQRFPNALTAVVDETGARFASFAYDALGRAVSTEHAGGVDRFMVSYGNEGARTVTSPQGTQYGLQFAAAKGVPIVGSASASSNWGGSDAASRVQNSDGTVNSETDFLGITRSWGWNSRQLPVTFTQADGRPESRSVATQWHDNYRLPLSISQASRSVAYTYDGVGNKLTETWRDSATGQSRTSAWAYNVRGLADTMTDAKGGVWKYVYDLAGNRTGSLSPVGQTISQSFDTAGRMTRRVGPNGLVSTYAYDVRGRLLTQINGNETTRYTYTPTGQLASATLPSGQSASYSYDAAQRLIAASDNRGNTVLYTLDAAGNRTREEVKDATGQIARLTSRVINSLNQVSAVRGASGQTTQLDYDANGEPIAQTDPLNQSTRQSLDALRRPVATTFADNAAAARAYNALDQLTQATDPKGVATSYTYNAFGDVMSETSPDIGTVSYERDALGDITKRTDAKGNITTITRDALGRPITTQYGANNTVHYSYDTAGYVSRIEDKSGTTGYERDLLGRILSKTQAVNDNPGAPTAYKTSYSYLSGELATITYPSGLVVTYKRSASGQITGIDTQEPGGTPKKPKTSMAFVANLAHTALGQPKAWTWSNGDAAARSFDADGRMTANEFAGYTFDAASRITGITQSLYAQGTGTVYLTPLSWTAGYDRRNRLTSFGRAGSESNYTYDANSNRLSAVDKTTSDTDLDGEFDEADFTRTTAQVSAQGNASNKLLGFTQTLTRAKAGLTKSVVTTPVTYSLDANGALTSDGLRSFEYDESDRLATVKLSKDGEAAKVTYLTNGLGQRAFKSEPQTDKLLPSEAELGIDFVTWLKKQFGWLFTKAQGTASIGTAFTYADGALPSWAVLGEYDNGSAAGKGRTEYIWLPTEDGQAIPVGIYRNGKFFAIHSDHLGTPRLMTNEAKQVVWQWPYSAFGSNKPTGVLKATDKPKQALTNQPVLLKATAATELNLRFPGQMEDVEAGSFYNYFRQYDPRTGRYTQADPIGLAGGLNRQGYVGGNTLAYFDPLGLGPWDKMYGFPKEFWRWFHKQENGQLMKEMKDPKTGQVPKDVAEQMHKEWQGSQKGAVSTDLLEIFLPWHLTPGALNSGEEAELKMRRERVPFCPAK